MYTHVLLPLDLSDSDPAIIEHVTRLAEFSRARISLVHIADGFAARYQEVLNLADSEEIHNDREYLLRRRAELQAAGLQVDAYLVGGEPARRIVELATELGCDLIAMGTHGHRGVADIILGSVAEAVRHRTCIPVLLLCSNPR